MAANSLPTQAWLCTECRIVAPSDDGFCSECGRDALLELPPPDAKRPIPMPYIQLLRRDNLNSLAGYLGEG